jgi:hypothetical protein
MPDQPARHGGDQQQIGDQGFLGFEHGAML